MNLHNLQGLDIFKVRKILILRTFCILLVNFSLLVVWFSQNNVMEELNFLMCFDT